MKWKWPFSKKTEETLRAAIAQRKPRLVEACLNSGVSPRATSDYWSPLRYAGELLLGLPQLEDESEAAARQFEIFRLLLVAGADPNERRFGRHPLVTALHGLCRRSDDESIRLVRLFLKHGFNVRSENGSEAMECTNGKVRQLLLEAGAPVREYSKNEKDYSPSVLIEKVEGNCPRCNLLIKTSVWDLFGFLEGKSSGIVRADPKTKELNSSESCCQEIDARNFNAYYCLGCNEFFRIIPEIRIRRESAYDHPFTGFRLTHLPSRDADLEDIVFPYGCPTCTVWERKPAKPISVHAIPKSRKIFGHNCTICGTLWSITRGESGYSWSGSKGRIWELHSCRSCGGTLCGYTVLNGEEENHWCAKSHQYWGSTYT